MPTRFAELDVDCLQHLAAQSDDPLTILVAQISALSRESRATAQLALASLPLLHFSPERRLTVALMLAAAEKCPALQSLDFEEREDLDDLVVTAIAAGFAKLTRLDMNYTHITDSAMMAVAVGCRQLVELNVMDCESITDAGVQAISAHCRKLECLCLGACEQLTDVAVHAVAAGCPQLTQLCVGGCEELTDAAVEAVTANCPNLQLLDLSECPKLTDAALEAVATRCWQLRSLDFTDCDSISEAAVDALRAKRPKPNEAHRPEGLFLVVVQVPRQA